MAVKVAKRVGGLCGSLVSVNPEYRASVHIAARDNAGVFQDAEREAIKTSDFDNVLRGCGRVAAVSHCKTRIKVIFKNIPNGLWFDAYMLLWSDFECSCGARYKAKGFGELAGYCPVCSADADAGYDKLSSGW
jgi:hypothetical protein